MALLNKPYASYRKSYLLRRCVYAYLIFTAIFVNTYKFLNTKRQLSKKSLVVMLQQTSEAIAENNSLELINNIPEVSIEEILRKDLVSLKYRVDRIEKAFNNPNNLYKQPLGTVSNFIESITANTMELNAQNIEICSIIGFFGIGSIIGIVTWDRLWLIGGLILGYWASEVVHTNSRGGMIARRIGVQLAQFVRDIQERVNQAMIFYRTGKLAYHSSKWWETYDSRLQITQRYNIYKRLVMLRYSQLSETTIASQFADMYKVLIAVPERINKDFGITSNIINFGKHVLSSSSNLLSDIIDYSRNVNGDNQNQPKTVLSRFVNKLRGRPANEFWYRGRLINPWVPFWKYLKFNKKE